jgi:hypothetical protein
MKPLQWVKPVISYKEWLQSKQKLVKSKWFKKDFTRKRWTYFQRKQVTWLGKIYEKYITKWGQEKREGIKAGWIRGAKRGLFRAEIFKVSRYW